MAQKKVFWLVSTKAKGLKFKVLQLDKESMQATLEGDTGVPFVTSITPDALTKLGYEVQVTMGEVADAAPVHSQPETA
jgi:hypothetical protein